MKNPWRHLSKVSPQCEDGHRRIATDVLTALYGAVLTGAELKICLCVIHHSWGFGKAFDTLSVGQIARETKLSERMVRKAAKALRDRRILHFEPSERVHRGSPLNAYLFNKHYDTWKQERVSSSSGVSCGTEKGELEGIKRVNCSSVTIDNTKDNTISARKNRADRSDEERFKSAPRYPPDHQKAVRYWCDSFEERFGVRYDFSDSKDGTGGKNGKLIKSLLKTYGYKFLVRMMDAFLDTDDEWVKGHDAFTIAMLKSQANKIALKVKRNGSGGDPVPAKPGGYGDDFSRAGTTPLTEQIRQLKEAGQC